MPCSAPVRPQSHSHLHSTLGKCLEVGLRSLPSWKHSTTFFHLASVSSVGIMMLAAPEPSGNSHSCNSPAQPGLRVIKVMEVPFLIFQKVPVINERCSFLLGHEQSRFSSQRKSCGSGFPGYGMSASGCNDSHPETLKITRSCCRKGGGARPPLRAGLLLLLFSFSRTKRK